MIDQFPGYPDLDGFAYSLERAELRIDGSILTAISHVGIEQRTAPVAIWGSRPFPVRRAPGRMELGEGKVTFSDELERALLLYKLGDAWREHAWDLTWLLVAPKRPVLKYACTSCHVTNAPVSHDPIVALGGDIEFSFMSHTINGKAPHTGLKSPTR